MLIAEFSQLQSLLLQQKSKLENSRTTKKLTKAESMVFDTITNALDASLRRVEKEVDDVEVLVE